MVVILTPIVLMVVGIPGQTYFTNLYFSGFDQPGNSQILQDGPPEFFETHLTRTCRCDMDVLEIKPTVHCGCRSKKFSTHEPDIFEKVGRKCKGENME